MSIDKAIEVVKILAGGKDPITGEEFPPDSHYNNPEVIRALFLAVQELENSKRNRKLTPEERQQRNIERGLPRNLGMSWKENDRQFVATQFKESGSVLEIAKKLERTRGSIIAELQRQGIVTPEQARGL